MDQAKLVHLAAIIIKEASAISVLLGDRLRF
jgi:hypothetical protein